MDERLGGMTVDAALDAIGARTPSPGGGAAVALGAATAVALGEMVAAYAVTRKANAEHADALGELLESLRASRAMLLSAADDDARAYRALSDAMAAKRSGTGSAEVVGKAAQSAAAVPMRMIDACRAVISALEGLQPYAGQLVSDLVASAAMATAAARGAVGHVLANAPLIEDETARSAIVARARQGADQVARRAEALIAAAE